jgi:RHS repeat-associated protein
LSHATPSGTVTATYDNQDRLTQYGDWTYAYGANGELLTTTTNGQSTVYEYDLLGNLRMVQLPDGTLIEYIIDARNRRIGKTINGILAQVFLYADGLRPIAQLDDSGNIISRFVYSSGSNVPSWFIRSGVMYRIIVDQLGSPRLVVDVANGNIAQHVEYDAFGRELANNNLGLQPFGFAGGVFDNDTGLLHFGEREYDALTGRWLSKDALVMSGWTDNAYEYVRNDPINLKDSLGLEEEGSGDHDLDMYGRPKQPSPWQQFLNDTEQFHYFRDIVESVLDISMITEPICFSGDSFVSARSKVWQQKAARGRAGGFWLAFTWPFVKGTFNAFFVTPPQRTSLGKDPRFQKGGVYYLDPPR